MKLYILDTSITITTHEHAHNWHWFVSMHHIQIGQILLKQRCTMVLIIARSSGVLRAGAREPAEWSNKQTQAAAAAMDQYCRCMTSNDQKAVHQQWPQTICSALVC